jgi:hypothetical protein
MRKVAVVFVLLAAAVKGNVRGCKVSEIFRLGPSADECQTPRVANPARSEYDLIAAEIALIWALLKASSRVA